ncbi:MAG: 2-amino-4-hydroxy-6-hydroxymethyldihydropteridine diphosphokinase [Armatimonadetes bacterium]|nr:2-amino-4-hydroxy-6-hydroxymethyldihydropteridine diphosphokinase [Armatimonadota bacterium]
MACVRCFLGLGANLGDKEANLKTAISFLEREKNIRVRRVAPFYRTAPWGYTDQDWFINTVVEIETSLSPQQLLSVLLAIEEKMGRVREVRWGPRVIDLDLLLYGNAMLYEPNLIVPHPRMAARAFVLAPLADLDPDLVIPGQGRVADLYKKVREEQDVKKL